MSETGTPSTRAVASRMPKWPWLLHQIVSLSLGAHHAVAFCGSM